MTGISRRTLLALPVGLALAGTARAAAAPAALPILPFHTNFSFWDHHWIQWLHDHPRYEAIEVALGAPLPSGEPLVRLWFTEREGGKRQVYYFNDPGVARTFGQESHFAAIDVLHAGPAGAPRDLSLRFTDKDGAPVRWEMRFAGEGVTPTGAGLKPQNGHAARSVLLFWYVDPGAITADARVTIGEMVHVPSAELVGQRRYHAAYVSGAYSAVLVYGQSENTPTPDGFRSSWANRGFVRQGSNHVARFEAFGQPASIEVECTDDHRLLAYRHTQGSRFLLLDMAEPLRMAPDGAATGFTLFAGGAQLASGTVTPVAAAGGGVRLQWEFADPAWAREVGLGTTATPRDTGGYGLRTAPLR